MGKKRKNNMAGNSKGKEARGQKKKGRGNVIMAVVVGALVAVGIYMLAGFKGEKATTAQNTGSMAGVVNASGQSYEFRETRPTLSPALFQGRAAEAYRVAKKIPHILDQLYCYCRCAENFGHKSLLSCYVDKHAAR